MRTDCDNNCNFKRDKQGNTYCTRCGLDKKKNHQKFNPFFFLLFIFLLPYLYLLVDTLNDGLQQIQYNNTSYTRTSKYR